MANEYSKMTKAELLEALQRLEGARPEGENRDLSTVLEELHIHQTELEMQNRELKEAYLQLENALDRYQSLFDFAPVAYFTFDLNGHIVEMNHSAREALGVDQKDVIDKRFSSYVAPGHVREFISHLRQVFQSNDELITEIPLKVGEKELIMQVFSSRMELEHDHRRVCRSAMIDVTERRRIERQLQESEERYRRLFYPISDAVLLVDQGSETVIDNNAAAIALYGYPARQLIGMKLSNLFEDPGKCHVILQNPSRVTMVLSQRKEDGTTFPAEMSVYRFIHRGLVVAGVTVRDLTGQRRREESHRREEEAFRNATRNMPAFFAIYDQAQCYRFVNAIAESWLQQTASALEGGTDEERVPEAIRRQYLPILLEAYDTKSVQSGRCVFQTPQGTVEAIMKFSPVLDDAGQIKQVVAVGWEAGEGTKQTSDVRNET